MRLKPLSIVLLICLVAVSCARQPTDKKVSKLAQRYFNKYGRKYKTSSYGLSKIQKVDVEDTEELHKGMVQSKMTLTNKDGLASHVLCIIERKAPLGWRIISWEDLF